MPIPQLTRFYRGVNPRIEWNADKSSIVKLHHSDEEESWIALFIDLVYVAMFINVGHVLDSCGSNTDTVRSAFIVFMIMFISRYSIDEYSNRFFADDIFHRLVYFVYTFGVFIMTMNISSNIPGGDEEHRRHLMESQSEIGNCLVRSDYANGFAAGFIITRVSLVSLYSMVSYCDRRAAGQFWIYILRHGASLMAMVAFVLDPTASFSSSLMLVGLIELLCTTVVPRILRFRAIEKYNLYNYVFPLDIYEVQSRLGIFVMMVLGESMIQLLTDAYNTHHTNQTYLFQG